MAHWLLRTVRTGAMAALAIPLYLLGCQSRMIYFPRAYQSSEIDDLRARGGVVLEFEVPAGKQRAFFLPGPRSDSRLWFWCPGNAALSLDYVPEVRSWDPEAGWLMIDYPSYGNNPGRPSPESVRQSVVGAVGALAVHLKTTPEALASRLGAAGQSLGAAAALLGAEALELDRVVVVAPFSTMTEMGRRVVGWPLCLLNHHRYDNRRTLAAVTGRGARVWIVHGEEDEVIPVEMARELAALNPAAVRLIEVPGARHNDVWDVDPGVLRRVFREAGGR